jgi:glycosyltransferase involved in cell wall biosynthesis
MKCVHVIPHMDEEASGPAQSVVRLCEALVLNGQDVEMHTMAAGRQPIGVDLILHKQWSMLGQFGVSVELLRSLHRTSRDADIVHNHSLWSFPNMAAGLATRLRPAHLVTSPRGTLAAAARARSRLKKMLFSPVQSPTITRASCLHATSQMEYQDIRAFGARQPVAIIPNGIDIPDLAAALDEPALNGPRRLLFLGRLHPIKGIEFLLNAWCALHKMHPDWELVIAGKGDDSYTQSLQSMSRRLQLERISFLGPVYGDAKRQLYCSSDLFILPTETENFGMAIAEALAHAVPVVTTRGAPWAGLEGKHSGWWVARSQQNIDEALNTAMNMEPESLRAMGRRGREWMAADFEWNTIATKMISVYRWLHEGGGIPDCVSID